MIYNIIYVLKNYTTSFVLLLMLIACKQKTFVCCVDNKYEESNQKLLSSSKVDSSIIEMQHFDKITGTLLPDFSFGIHHIYLHDKHYIVYLLNDRTSLIFINPFDSSDIINCAVGNSLKKGIPYNTYIHGNVLHCIGDKELVYKQLQIDTTYGRLKEILSVDLKEAIGNNPREFIYSNLVVDKSLAFINPYLIIPFGDYKGKNTCGNRAWKIVNIFTKKVFTALDFPEKYRKCDLRIPDSFIEPGDSNDVYGAFLKFDKVYKMTIPGREIVKATNDSVFPNRFLCYDAELQHNMAYKDKYERLDENNENLIFNPNTKQIVLIKKLRRKAKDEPIQCAILVFNSNLNHIGTYYTSGGFYPKLSYWYKNGVVITDSSFSKGYYYAFSN